MPSSMASELAIRERLGRYATGASRDVRAASDLATGEVLVAAVVAMWERKGWVVVAAVAARAAGARPAGDHGAS